MRKSKTNDRRASANGDSTVPAPTFSNSYILSYTDFILFIVK